MPLFAALALSVITLLAGAMLGALVAHQFIARPGLSLSDRERRLIVSALTDGADRHQEQDTALRDAGFRTPADLSLGQEMRELAGRIQPTD